MEPEPRKSLPLVAYLFLLTSTMGFLQPFGPLYMEAAGLSRSAMGIVAGVGTGLAVLIQPLIGRLSDRWDQRRPFVALAALAAGTAFFSYRFAVGFVPFLILSALGSNGTVYLNTAGGVIVGRMVQARHGGGTYARYRVWGSVGYIVASLLTGFLVGKQVSTRAGLDPIFVYGPLLFVVIAIIAWRLPDVRREGPRPTARARAPMSPNLRNFLAAYFFYTIALYGSTGFLSLYLKTLGASGPWISGTFAAGVVCEVLVMPRAGALSDQFGRRPLLVLAFLLLPIRLLLYAPATGPLWVLAVQSLHGLNFGIVGSVAIAMINDLTEDATRGHAQARLAAVTGVATAIGPALFGWISQRAGLPTMFIVSAGFAAVGAVIMLFRVEDSHPQSQSIADRGPARLRPWTAWLDRPGGSKT